MKNIKKFSILGAVLAIFMLNSAYAGTTSTDDYLKDKNVSYLLIANGASNLITTYGWMDASEACKNLTEAGYSVDTVRNITADGNNKETFAECN